MAFIFFLPLAGIATANAHSRDGGGGYPSPPKSKAKLPYHSQTVIFIRSRQKQQNVNEMLFVWMKGLASEPAFLWMKPGLAAGARQSPGSSGLSQWAAAPMTHSTKACSIVEDSISIKGGIFHPTAVWEKKKKSQPDYKDVGRKKKAVMMRRKTSFSKEIQDPLDRYECE